MVTIRDSDVLSFNVFLLLPCLGQCITPGWFGNDCQFECHCANNADCDMLHGDCPGTCAAGYFGPACQFVSSPFMFCSPSEDCPALMDQNDETCSSADLSNLEFVFVENKLLTWIRIVFNDSSSSLRLQHDSRNQLQLEVAMCDERDVNKCEPQKKVDYATVVNNRTLDIFPTVPKVSFFFLIVFPEPVTVCSVYARTDSDCPPSRFGAGCESECNCVHQGYCVDSAGRCTSGCPHGYTGQDCWTPCPDGHFGSECNETCSVHCSGSNHSCDHRDGACNLGCDVGYQPPVCKKTCDAGTYGPGCSKNCSLHCSGPGHMCDAIHGSCELGCDAGYIAPLCDTAVRSDTNCTAGSNHNLSDSKAEALARSCGIFAVVAVVSAAIAGAIVVRKR